MSARWHGFFGPSPEEVALAKAKEDRANAEYERDLQKRETKLAQERERNLRDHLHTEMASAQEQRHEMQFQIMELEQTISLFEQWLRKRNLWDEANAWVAEQLES